MSVGSGITARKDCEQPADSPNAKPHHRQRRHARPDHPHDSIAANITH
jgi:hypothetical protein